MASWLDVVILRVVAELIGLVGGRLLRGDDCIVLGHVAGSLWYLSCLAIKVMVGVGLHLDRSVRL